MMPNVVKGSKMVGLVVYLQGAGRANEHTNPRVVAGHDRIMFEFGGPLRDRAAAVALARMIDEPRQLHLAGEPVLATN